MTAKSVNYTAEQTAELVSAYTAAPTAETVAAFAEKFGKSVKSIVAKLSRENAYIKVEKQTAGRVARKAEVILALELMVGAELKSLNHATVKDLEAVLNFVKREGQ